VSSEQWKRGIWSMGKAVKVFLFFSLLIFHFSFVNGQVINNLQWLNVDQEVTEATIREGITLYAQTESIDDGEPVTVTIWSKCGDADDLVGRYVTRVNNNRVVFHWMLDFKSENLPKNQKEIDVNGYTSPQYYFDIRFNALESQKSGLLDIMVRSRSLIYNKDTGEPWRDHRIRLYLPDRTRFETRTDPEGYVTIHNLKAFGEINFLLLNDTEETHEIIQPYREPEKPAYYIIKENDNSLREIAAYDFIYGDPDLWDRLYAANRHNLKDDGNPDLLEPGQALIIPPVENETREGTR
jgi:hypothetical protein